jgi:hypothetical protein
MKLNTLNGKLIYVVMSQRNIATIAEKLCIKATATSADGKNMMDVVLCAPEWVPSLRGIQPREASQYKFGDVGGVELRRVLGIVHFLIDLRRSLLMKFCK